MFFNSRNARKFVTLSSFIFLLGCAAKTPVVELDPVLEAQRLQVQKEQEQFKQALGLIQTNDATEKDLLKAKDILDALYESNTAYLGALINSADISLMLEKYIEAKGLYLEAKSRVDQRKESSTDVLKTTLDRTNFTSEGSSQIIPEHHKLFMVHIYNQLGLIERQQGQFDQAESYYRQALALEPGNTVTLKNLAILLDLYRGQLAEALTLYQQYQSIVGDTDPQVKDWIYDLKNRLPANEVVDE